MDKQTLLKLLDDPEVAEKILAIKKEAATIPKVDERKIIRLINWWVNLCDKNKATPANELSLWAKRDLLKLMKKNGEPVVKEVLLKAVNSPLRNSVGFMQTYLRDFNWCVKSENFTKIQAGNYDSQSQRDATQQSTNRPKLKNVLK